MQRLLPRQQLLSAVRTGLQESPVVVLLGARQVGKTTLALQIAEAVGDAVLFDLERPAGRAALSATPELTLRDCRGLAIIDEVQRMPELFSLLRPLCDESDRNGRFLLLGSASPELVRGVSESLAGRVQFVPVRGFSLDEVGPESQDRLWLRGGFPRSYLAPTDGASWRWREGFRQTFLERDLPALSPRVAPAAVGRFWAMLAHYHGQLWNASEFGRAMDVSPGTAAHYRDLLSGSYMVRVLQPWYENLGKRQLKSPRVYIRDSGMLHHFLGVGGMAELRAHPRYGASWEGFALEQTLIAIGERDAYFWATHRGAELDLLLLRRGGRLGFEFKCTDAPTTTRSMHISLEDLGLRRLYVVYPGVDRYPLGDRITALPAREIASVAGTLPND